MEREVDDADSESEVRFPFNNLIYDLGQTKFILKKFQVIYKFNVNYLLKMVKVVDAQPESKGLDDRGSSVHYLDYIQCQALFCHARIE